MALHNEHARALLVALLLMVVAGGAAGCQHARVEQPLSAELINSQGDDDQMTFWHELTQRPLVANDEAFHALLLFADGKDTNTSYDERVSALKQRKMLPGSFDAPADQAITRGDLAVALAGALDIKGGVMLRLLPRSRRYATREMVYEGIFPQGSEHQTFSGEQFVGIIGRAEDRQREQDDRGQDQRRQDKAAVAEPDGREAATAQEGALGAAAGNSSNHASGDVQDSGK